MGNNLGAIMFVRWQKRRLQTPKFGSRSGHERRRHEPYSRTISYRGLPDGTLVPDYHWSAILVESLRIGGKPRQKHVAYLGSITDSGIEITQQRDYFWKRINASLDRLSDRLSGEQRVKIEAKIAEKVPPVSESDLEEAHREAEDIRDQIAGHVGVTPAESNG